MTSLVDELNQLLNPAPTSIDTEDDVDFDTRAQVVEKYEKDEEPLPYSILRKQNFQLTLDSRYVGKKVSRKQLLDELTDSDDDRDEILDDDEDNALVDKALSADEIIHEENLSNEEFQEEDSDNITDNESEVETADDSDDNEGEDDMVQKFSNIDVDEEVEKGKAVKAQLSLWDSLLESRIRLQKVLIIANKLPQSNTWNQFFDNGGKDYRDLINLGNTSVKHLLDLFLDLQTELLQKNSETRHIISDQTNLQPSTNYSDEEISSEEDEDKIVDDDSDKNIHQIQKRRISEEEYPNFLAKRHKAFTPFRNSTIQKWNEKTRISMGRLHQSSFYTFEHSILKQIEQVLSDKPRLIKRTQLRRSKYRVLGKSEEIKKIEQPQSEEETLPMQEEYTKDYDTEIFDDDDFYHQLLRELIERKTADINDPIALSRQWLEIQKLRSKMKKKVDTKASKGRKIRYDVHSKMVNFMAPVDHCTMSDEAKNDLYQSLFGKGIHQKTTST